MNKTFSSLVTILLILILWFLYFFQFLFKSREGDIILGPAIKTSVYDPEKSQKDTKALNPDALMGKLIEPEDSEYQKARKIYEWIAKNIAYDDEAFNNDERSNETSADILLERKAVCEGYANLFVELSTTAGLKAEKIIGYDRGFEESSIPKQATHAWNRVWVGDRWLLLDATWGSGTGEKKWGKITTTQKFNQNWFDVNPEDFILSHLPVETTTGKISVSHQQVNIPVVSKKEFFSLPQINSIAPLIGFKGDSIRYLAAKGVNHFVEVLSIKNEDVKVLEAPYVFQLKSAESYNFIIKSTSYGKLSLVFGKNFFPFSKKDSFFTYTGTIPKGAAQIVLAEKSTDTEYEVFLKYEVR